MRFSTSFLLALPVLVAAQQQKPLGENLQAWFDKAKSYIPGSPLGAGAARVAAKNVTPLTKDNWAEKLKPTTSNPSKGPETWMVFVSGGNKTCYGLCAGVETAWNESAAIFAADPTAPHLGYIDCDTNAILCSIWAAGPPAIWYFLLPIAGKDQSTPATTIYIVPLNTTTTTANEIVQIHTAKNYEKRPVYESFIHPFDGWLAKAGLNVPVGYILFGFGLIPSWSFMLLISFVSRTVMSRRIGNPNVQRAEAQRRAQPQGGAPAANNL